MREYHVYEVNASINGLSVNYAIPKKRKITQLYEVFFVLFGMAFFGFGIYQFVLKEVGNGSVMFMIGTWFIIMSAVLFFDYKNKKPYSLKVDSIGFHEESVNFKQKSFLWEEVCYINFFPDIICEGGKTVQTYGAVVISKVDMNDEQREEFVKKQVRWSSIHKAKWQDHMILLTGTTQARRIYELISDRCFIFGDKTALKRKIDS